MPWTVNQLLDAYERDFEPLKSPTTQRSDRAIFPQLRAQVGHLRLAALTLADLRDFRTWLLARYPASTVRRRLQVLSGAFTAAVKEYEQMPDNPMRKIRMPHPAPGRVRFLSEAERHRLLIACQSSRNPALYPVVLLALATGARRGELLALRWRDVEVGQGTLTFQRTKNGETRTVPVVGLALQVLRQWRLWDRGADTWVFPSMDGHTQGWVDRAFRNAVGRAGMTNFRFHDLRHTAASYLAMNGASLLEIAEVLGHKTLAMTKRYAHLSPNHTRGVVEKMALRFLTPGEPPTA